MVDFLRSPQRANNILQMSREAHDQDKYRRFGSLAELQSGARSSNIVCCEHHQNKLASRSTVNTLVITFGKVVLRVSTREIVKRKLQTQVEKNRYAEPAAESHSPALLSIFKPPKSCSDIGLLAIVTIECRVQPHVPHKSRYSIVPEASKLSDSEVFERTPSQGSHTFQSK